MKKIMFILMVSLSIVGCGKKFKLDRSEMNIKPSWSFERYDLSNRGSIESGNFNGSFDVLWEYESNDKPSGPLTIYFDKLIYPGAKKRIKFIDIESGKYEGSVKPKKPSQTVMVIKDSLGFISSTLPIAKLRCFNLLSNKTVWMKRVKDALSGSIIYNNKLFVSYSDGEIACYELLDGEEVWSSKFEHGISVSPLIINDELCQVVDQERIYFLDPESGDTIKSLDYEGEIVAPPIYDKNLFLIDYRGEIGSLNLETGTTEWQTEIEGLFASPAAIDEKHLYVAKSFGKVFALDKRDGRIIWEFDAVDAVSSSILAVNGFVVFGTLKGDLYSLRAADGSVVDKRKLKGPLAIGPISNGDVVLTADNKGLISCFGELNKDE